MKKEIRLKRLILIVFSLLLTFDSQAFAQQPDAVVANLKGSQEIMLTQVHSDGTIESTTSILLLEVLNRWG